MYEQTHRRYVKARQYKHKEFLWKLKSEPCTDCGQKFHPVAMEFDHVRGEKVRAISQMACYTRDRLVREIDKCELVCSNCHRIRTYTRLVQQ